MRSLLIETKLFDEIRSSAGDYGMCKNKYSVRVPKIQSVTDAVDASAAF